MRTVIFSGLIYVGDSIGKVSYDKEIIRGLALILIAAILMDIVDFIRNKK